MAECREVLGPVSYTLTLTPEELHFLQTLLKEQPDRGQAFRDIKWAVNTALGYYSTPVKQ